MAGNTVIDPHTAIIDTPPAPAAGGATAPGPNATRPASPQSNGKTAVSDAFREHSSGDAPLADKVKSFAKARPWASAAVAGIAGLAILNSVRRKRG